MNRVIMWIIVLSLCFMFGCQPSPEKDLVISKQDDVVAPLIENTPSPVTEYLIEERRWIEQYDVYGIECNYDLEIEFPESRSFPVYNVSRHEFSNQDIEKLVKYFTDGALGVRITQPTKEELTKSLLEVKRGRIEVDSNGQVTWVPYEGQEQDISNLEEQIRNAPAEEYILIESMPIDLPWNSTYLMADESRIYISADHDGVSIRKEPAGIVQTEELVSRGNAYPGEPSGSSIDNIKITDIDAISIATDIMLKNGIDSMGLAEINKARMIEDYTYNIVSQGWLLEFERNDGGSLPVNSQAIASFGMMQYDTSEYSVPWPSEHLRMYIDETGMRSFTWAYPLQINSVTNENVQLMPFAEIKSILKNNVKLGLTWLEDDNNNKDDHKIQFFRLVLTNRLYKVPNRPQDGALLPTWLLYYKRLGTDRRGIMSSVIAINAIDGSRMGPLYNG